jgi:hypothetical protein
MTQTATINWFLILQSVIAGVLVVATIGVFRFGRAVERWYRANENRLIQLEKARVRHALRLERAETFLEETHPGKFFRRRVDDLIIPASEE